ncbi:MAG: c-type cytochrome [Candidatus Eiseniibacteriota bacterium]
MLKGLLSLVLFAFAMLLAATTIQQGCQDVKSAWVHLDYYPVRDMRRTVVVNPQKVVMLAPDSMSVPMQGRDLDNDYLRDPNHMAVDLATKVGDTLKDPTAGATDESIARGKRKFMKTCLPCHGVVMAGDGTVAPKFMPPPDLLAQTTRERKDGYIFSYIRHGGMIMPSYGAQVTADEAWDLIHYIRSMQKSTPR